MSYSSPDEDWFQYTNDFNQRAESPGGNGVYNFDSGNIDNIPLNDDDQQEGEFDLAVGDDYPYGTSLRLSPGQNEQPGTSGSNDVGGQFQSMHVMQNNDTFDQHMHQSSSMEYNAFEMPTVISTNLDAGPYIGMDDPNSFYASQQPSTSQGNDMVLTDSYDMMGQQTAYLAQVDHMDPSTSGNPSSHSGMNQQNDNGVPVQQLPPKAKPKKRSSAKKKPATSAGDTVGSVLQKAANRNSQQVENGNDKQETKVEARLTLDETILMQELMEALKRLKDDANADQSEIQNLETQIFQLFSKSMVTQEDPNNGIVNQIKSRTGAAGISAQPTPPPPPPPPKKAPPKKKNTKSAQQQQQQQPQPQMMLPAQAQITPAKIVMDPPTTTMVPSNSHMQNMYEGVNENYSGYPQMDEQGTSQQRYNDFQQPHSQESIHHQNQFHQQAIHTKVVPTMNQKTHNYRQSVALPSQNVNGSGQSTHLQQPRSHDNHHTEQVQEQQYHSQDHRRPQSRQVYPPSGNQHQDGQAYQSQEAEPTLGDVVRKTQGRYQGPQDAPNLRQQLISNVNASTNKQLLQRSGAPTPSPGNFHNNNIHHHQQQHQYVEPYQNHSSYPSSHDMQPSSQSQQGYENHQQYEPLDDFYDGDQSRSQEHETILMQPEIRQQQYEQQEMYAPIEESEPVVDDSDMYYVELPVRTGEASKETLEEKLEEKRLARVEKVKNLMAQQLNHLESGLDLAPFRGKMDILERMLPFHHLSVGEEPVSNFDSTYDQVMSNAITHANTLGSRIRNIVLRDTMRKSTEWEENMLLFLETESERRKLEEDRQLATQDVQLFLQNSDVIHNVQNGRLNLELSKQTAPPMPTHLKDLNLKPDELSAVYKDYEFDSYDENRPRGSPFVYEELESESEFDEEQDEENEEEADEQPTRSDLSPLVGFPQPSPIPSPSRDRNESESTFDWRDEDESPLLSPETEIYKKVTDDLFGTQEDLEKSEPFPFKEISEAARKQMLQQPGIAESIGSSGESSSTSGSPPRNNDQAKARSRSPMSSTSYARTPSPDLIEVPAPSAVTRPIYRVNLYEGSPEIGEDYSMSPEPTPSVPNRRKKNVSGTSGEVSGTSGEVSKIKNEKEDSTQGLRLRIPVSIYQKGVKLATNEDDDVQEIPSEFLEKRSEMDLENDSTRRSTSRRNSRSTPSSGSEPSSSQKIAKASLIMADDTKTGSSRHETTVFKTPFQTPLKTTVSGSRKRRGGKIDDSTPQNKKGKGIGSFETPKNGLVGSDDAPIGRFLRTMTDGRRIVMKIGKIPNNINHFVTPRRDKKGNLHKNLSPSKNTRLKMRLFKRNGELSVEVTEHFPTSLEAAGTSISNEPSTSSAEVAAPILSTVVPVKGRPAPASRKPSLEASGKEKKVNLPKNKIAYTNRFNPFANSTSSKPPTSAVTPLARPPTSIIQSSSRPPKSTTPSSSRNATSVNSSYSKPSTSSSASKPSTSTIPSSFRKSSKTVPFSSKLAPSTNPIASTGQSTSMPSSLPSSSLSVMSSQAILGSSLIRTSPIVPKITVTNTTIAPEKIAESTETVEHKNTLSSLQPWIFNTNHSSKPTSTKPQAVPELDPASVTSTTNEHLQVNTDRSEDHAAPAQQESPRASSSLSFFDDDRTNTFPFLRSPPRTKEPLPLVEYSDDEDDDLVHSKFSSATDHLLGTSKMNKTVNGATSLVPWTDP